MQADFDRAVALLHHMMYEQSRAVFAAIAEEDPDCAMARWGIDTTLFQALWPTLQIGILPDLLVGPWLVVNGILATLLGVLVARMKRA